MGARKNSSEETQSLLPTEEGVSQEEGARQEEESRQGEGARQKEGAKQEERANQEEVARQEEGARQEEEERQGGEQPIWIQIQVVCVGIWLMCVLDGTMYGNVVFKKSLGKVRCFSVFLFSR